MFSTARNVFGPVEQPKSAMEIWWFGEARIRVLVSKVLMIDSFISSLEASTTPL